MSSIKELSKERLLKLVMKYYKDIDNEKELKDELLDHFKVNVKGFKKNELYNVIYNYYDQFPEDKLRKLIDKNFNLVLPKKKEEPKKPLISPARMKRLKEQIKQQDEYEKEQIKEFEKNIPNDPKLVKPKEKKEIIKTFDTIQNLINKFVSKSKATEKTEYGGQSITNRLTLHALIHKGIIECPIVNAYDTMTYKNFYFKDIISKRLSNCIKNKVKIILIRLNFAGHANLAIIKPETKELIRFEPQMPPTDNISYKAYLDTYGKGFDKQMIEIQKIIKDITGDKYKYIKPIEICPKMPVGLYDLKKEGKSSFQEIDETVPKPKEEGKGYCQMWSFFFGVLLISNPDLTESEVMKKAFEIIGTEPQTFRHVIRGFWIDILDEAKEIAKTLKYQFEKSIYLNPYKHKFTYDLKERDEYEKVINNLLDEAIEDRHKKIEKEKGGKLRSMYVHKSGLNLGYVNKKHFKKIKCLCKSKQPKNKHCSCSM